MFFVLLCSLMFFNVQCSFLVPFVSPHLILKAIKPSPRFSFIHTQFLGNLIHLHSFTYYVHADGSKIHISCPESQLNSSATSYCLLSISTRRYLHLSNRHLKFNMLPNKFPIFHPKRVPLAVFCISFVWDSISLDDQTMDIILTSHFYLSKSIPSAYSLKIL